MCETIRRLPKPLLRLITSGFTRLYQYNGRRCLYTDTALDLVDYKNARITAQVLGNPDVFKDTMKIILKNEENQVGVADLRKLLHIIEKNEGDICLLKTMLERYNQQDNEDSDYLIGPVVMRALHYLDEPLLALEAATDPKFKMLYDQPKTFAILVDLLYEHKMYKEVRDVYSFLRHRPVSKLVISIVAMACYKENTPESLEFAMQMWKDVCSKSKPLRRTIVTLTALALNQNQPEIALNIIAHCHNFNSISVRSTKVMALCDLDQLDKVLVDFRHALGHNSYYLADVGSKFKAAVRRLNLKPEEEIRNVFHTLQLRRAIQSLTLDEYISTPIDVSKRP
ncbi:pentatricopeptide repeat-containing protein 2, mitochondrial-like isoform X2 [Diachasmimorpha longicaudata]|uniref:pentatricopeptide repeat-containing protein 2, mitochondrial-like isoform X2 n=1 Tax=Diachasmimorpha longicaudata TaxID=58733 RepID=UPI0030B8B801